MSRKNTLLYVCGMIAFFGAFLLFPQKVLAYSAQNNFYVRVVTNGTCSEGSFIKDVPVYADNDNPPNTLRGYTNDQGYLGPISLNGNGYVRIGLSPGYALSSCDTNPKYGDLGG